VRSGVEKLLNRGRNAGSAERKIVVLSEAFTLSLQRIAQIDVHAWTPQRCNDSVNASLSDALDWAARPGCESSLQRRRVVLHRRHAAQRIPPNKRMQRTVEMAASFLMRYRAAADSQRYALHWEQRGDQTRVAPRLTCSL
jgi:hypothetical protein